MSRVHLLLCLIVAVNLSGAKVLWEKSLLRVRDIRGYISGEDNMAEAKNPAGGSSKVLRVFYPKGSYKPSAKPLGGSQFFVGLKRKRTIVTLSYEIYFAKNFKFVRGGKLPGVYGGSKKCSGGRDASNCFSTRFMFRQGGKGEVYLYAPKSQKKNFCDDRKVICNGKYGFSLGRGNWKFRTGKWQKISQRVRLNTPGKKNGYVKVWLNGKQVFYMGGLNLRQAGKVKIDGMYFSTFFGGSNKSWATPVNTYTFYRNFKMTT